MLDRSDDDRWLVRASRDAPPEAVVERFGGGWRLTRWSADHGGHESLGVYTAAELAEAAWWRHLDAGRGQRTASRSEAARRLGDA
jgi:hypothetical protein